MLQNIAKTFSFKGWKNISQKIRAGKTSAKE